MTKLTVRPINTGYVTTIPKEYLYHHSVTKYYPEVSDQRIEMPCFTFLIEGGEKLILVDTGMSWSERASEYHHLNSRQPEGMAIYEQLEKIGYHTEDVDIVIFTHLHWDHCYYANKFTNADLYVHEIEYATAINPIPLYYKSYEHPKLGITRQFQGLDFIKVSGEVEIAKGVRVFETPGHSPGHMSVEVDTEKGCYICAGDSVFVPDNLKPVPEMHYNLTPPGRFYDIIKTWKSIELQQHKMQDASFILCCHDAELEEIIKKTPVLGI
ncbi:MAG: N-acyl homoserine lactonase family protein [Eubacteriales bacterium]